MQAILLRLFVEIDFLIHKGVSEVLKLIFRIADTEIFSEGSIATFTSRVYGVLGVLILFKIIISAIQYLISPDKMTDKDKGFGGLLQRTIISVAMLALVPTIFDFARLAQDKITVAIPQVVLGMKIDDTSDIQAIGDNMSWITVKAFVSAKEGKNTSGYPMESLENFKDNVTQGCGWLWADENCIYEYNFFFSIIVGVFMLYILLSMGIDVAIRTIKFGLIEILAPIPIASYINNQENFKAWYQNAFKVYADLFIRFIIIYFIIFVIVILSNGGITIKSSGEVVSVLSDPFLYVFLIVGLLMFAKQAPKFISDILGLKSDGMGGIADMFKPVWSRGGFAAIGGMATAGVANAANRLQGFNKKSGWDKARALRDAALSGVAGAASAGLHGGFAAFNGKNGKDVIAAGHKRAVTARQNRDLDKLNHVGTWDRMAARAQDYLGLDTDASLAEGKQKAYSTVHQDVGNYKKAVMGRVVKEANVAIRNEAKAGSAISQLGKLMEDNISTIMASNNQDLINFSNKFERATDASGRSCWKLRAGESLSYHDLAAINADAKQAGIGSIAGLTDENGALTLMVQKELFEDAMKNKVYTTTGELHKTINAHSGNITYVNSVTGATETMDISTHTDISTAVGQAEQHLTENSVSLGTFKWVDSAGVEHVVEGAEQLKALFNSDFAKLDDLAQRQSAALSSQMSADKNAAARASIQRRDSNKKS